MYSFENLGVLKILACRGQNFSAHDIIGNNFFHVLLLDNIAVINYIVLHSQCQHTAVHMQQLKMMKHINNLIKMNEIIFISLKYIQDASTPFMIQLY